MTRATFHHITLDIPDGWEDGTLVTLLGPEQKALDLMRHNGASEAPERPSLIMKRVEVTSREVSLDEFAAAQEEVMRSMAPDTKTLAKETVKIAGQDAQTREFAFTAPPRALRQWQAYLYAGDAFYVICGTATNDSRFDAHKKIFVAVVESLSFV